MSKNKPTTDSRQLPLFDPITINLTKGCKAIIDPIDSDLARLKWCAIYKDDRPYAAHRVWNDGDDHIEYLHRLILERILGRKLETNELADHADNNPLNNCRGNIRLATKRQNVVNQKRSKRNTSGYKGVCWHKKTRRWRAYITLRGHQRALGFFDTSEEAHAAYQQAAYELFGEFARPE